MVKYLKLSVNEEYDFSDVKMDIEPYYPTKHKFWRDIDKYFCDSSELEQYDLLANRINRKRVVLYVLLLTFVRRHNLLISTSAL